MIEARQAPLGESLYAYLFLTRKLILRTKVSGDYRALSALKEVFVNHPTAIEMAADAETIVAAPSSFWGRVRGRFDLAYHLAAALSEASGKPLSPCPGRLYWRFKKRARQQNKEKKNLNFANTSDGAPVLIIDDIITTGYTLTQVARTYKDHSLSFLTLACASGH